MEKIIFTGITIEELKNIIREEVNYALEEWDQNKIARDKEEADFINLDGAMALLDLEKSTIYNLCSQSKLPHYKKSRRLYFKKSELIAWIESGKRKTIHEIKKSV